MSDAQLNRGFENESQLRAFIKALSDSVIPGKFAYVGEGAVTHDKHELTKEYGQITRSIADESSLLLEVWGRELNSIRTLVDVGPGNGLHSADLLRRVFEMANWSPNEYVAIDYSSHMAELAKKNLKRLVPGIQVDSTLFDIESTFTLNSSQLPNVRESIYLLLGNTIGNVQSISRTVKGIRSLAGKGARLLIGCALYDKYRNADSYLRPYRMMTYTDCILQPFIMIGVPKRLIAYTVEFDSNTRTIFTLVRFEEDFQADLPDGSITVKAGSTIQCALSRRFLPDEIPNLLKQLNVAILGVAEDAVNGHGTYCAII